MHYDIIECNTISFEAKHYLCLTIFTFYLTKLIRLYVKRSATYRTCQNLTQRMTIGGLDIGSVTNIGETSYGSPYTKFFSADHLPITFGSKTLNLDNFWTRQAMHIKSALIHSLMPALQENRDAFSIFLTKLWVCICKTCFEEHFSTFLY